MGSIRLKDGTIFNIKDGATENSVDIIGDLTEITILEGAFAEENLERFEILNNSGLVTAVIKDKCLRKIECAKQEDSDKYKFTLHLGNVDVNAKRIKELERIQAELIESQEIQDGAIMEIAEMISVGEEVPEEEIPEVTPEGETPIEEPETTPEVAPEDETPEEVVEE